MKERKAHKRRMKNRDEEDIKNLAVLWARREISYKDFLAELGVKSGYGYLALALRDILNENGRINKINYEIHGKKTKQTEGS